MGYKEWLDRSTIISDKKLLVFTLSFMAACLVRITDWLSEKTVAIIFLVFFVFLLAFLWILIREHESEKWKYRGRALLQTRWGTLGTSVLGFGAGALVYHYRAWFIWLWYEFRKIDKPDEWILVSLFLLGVMMGFFVVRNWSKSQQDFIASLTAALGAAFLATIMGALAGNKPAATAPGASQQTLTTEVPATGTATPTPAATGAAPPTGGAAATPTPTPAVVRAVATTTPTSAASSSNLLDPVSTFSFYLLGFTLSGTLNLLAFALLAASYTRTQSLASRSVIDFLYGSDKAQAIDLYFLKNFEADPDYAKAKLVAALSEFRESVRRGLARMMNMRRERYQGVTSLPYTGASPALRPGDVSGPFDYFELLSIKSIQQESDNQVSSPPLASPPDSPPVNNYEIVFRRLREHEHGSPGDRITAKMFRVSVSIRWRDNLEYIVATGEYRKSFPYYGSVAGMSLLVRRTIVMNRDKYKKFRTGDFVEGKTPNQADQPRGLYEIDFLSYICVPMVSSLGKPEEQSLGVLHVDTKLFACPKGTLPADSCRQSDADSKQEIYRIVIGADPGERLEDKLKERLKEFEAYACNLYEQNDSIIDYLESLRGVVVPLLELYKKCRTGAINEPTA
jgi:hypothetical protein